jgi:transcriptional regulator with XRE-family HTH domain
MSTKNTAKGQNFSDCLKAVLEMRGLTQRFIVDKGIGDSAQVSRWVTGKVVPYPKTQKALGDALAVVFKQLSDGSYAANDLSVLSRNSLDIVRDLEEQYVTTSLDDLSKILERIESFAHIAREDMEQIESFARIAREAMHRLNKRVKE